MNVEYLGPLQPAPSITPAPPYQGGESKIEFLGPLSPGFFSKDLSSNLQNIADTVTRPFKAQGAEAAKAFNQSVAGFSQRLDDLVGYVNDKTGIPKSGIFQKAADFYNQNAAYWDGKAKEAGPTVIDEIVGSAVGGAIPGVAEFALNVPYSAAVGAAEAHKEGGSELMGAVTEGGKRALLGQVFHAAGQLKQPAASLASGTAMATQTYSEGGSPEDIAKSAGVGALYGAMSPGGRIGIREIKDSVKADVQKIGEIVGYNARDGKPIIDMEAKEEAVQAVPTAPTADVTNESETVGAGFKPAPTEKPVSFKDEIKAGHPDLTDEDISSIAKETAAKFDFIANTVKDPRTKGGARSASDAFIKFAETGEIPLAKKGKNQGKPLAAFEIGKEEFDKQIRSWMERKSKPTGEVQKFGDLDIKPGDKVVTPNDTYTLQQDGETLQDHIPMQLEPWDDIAVVEVVKGNAPQPPLNLRGGETPKGKDVEMFANVNQMPPTGLKTDKAQAEDLLEGFRRPDEDRQAGMFSGSATADTGGYAPSIQKQIEDLYGDAVTDKNNRLQKVNYGIVDSNEASRIKQDTNFDVEGYSRVIDNYSIRHILKEHGDEKQEELRGQLPITKADIARIPEITANADKITYVGKTNVGRDTILYEKRVNGIIYYYEEIRTKHGELVPVSMRKMKATTTRATPDESGGVAQTSETFRGSSTWKTRTASNAPSSEGPPLTSETLSRNLPNPDNTIPPSPEGVKTPNLMSIIREIERIIAPDTDVRLKDRIEVDHEVLKESLAKWGGGDLSKEIKIKGAHRVVTVSGERMRSIIYLSLNYMNPKITPYHEAFHSVQEFLLTDAEKAVLDARYPARDGVSSHERQAQAFADYVHKTKGLPPVSVRRIFETIKGFFESLNTSLKGAGYKSASDIFEAAYNGELRKRAEESTTPTPPYQGGESGSAAFAPDKEFRREAGSDGAEGNQKRSDIAKFLQEKLDVPIRTGRFTGTGRGVMGIFKGKEEVIRTKFANDIETIAHEVGHGLQKYLWPDSVNASRGAAGFSGKPFESFTHELEPIATATRKGQDKTTEGFAEFVRLYVTNEAKAIQQAPEFYNHFDTLLQEKAPEAREILLRAREDFNRWINQPAMSRVLGQISVGENKSPARDMDTLFKEAYTATIDDLYPLRKVVQEMTGKEEIPAIKDPYKMARLLRGWWGKAESFLEYKPFDYNNYEWKGESFKQILEPVKDNLDEFRAYIVSRRALELNERGIESGISAKDARKVVNDLDKKYRPVQEKLIEYQDNLLRYLRDSGVIAPRDFARMKKANREYVPFYRVFEGEGAKGPGKGLEANDPIKGIKGSWRDIVDPLESIVKNTYLFINVAERNSVGRALVDLANSKEGMGKFVERIPTPKSATRVGVGEVLDKWAEKLEDPHIKEMLKEMNLSDETVSIFRPSAFVPKDNVISVWDKGKRNLYEVSPDVARAFQALDKETTNTIVRLLSYPASWLRAGATLTPEFIARNPLRDQFSAFVYSKYGYIPGFDLPKAIAHMVKSDETYWNWKRSGGEHSMLVSLDREYLQKNLEKIMQSKMEGMKDLIKNPIEALRVLSELGESATRVGEFTKGVQKEGMSKEGMLDAAFSSREVTLDFARIGAKTKAVNAMIAFWNANVQGTDRMVRAFKDRPLESAFKVMAGITLPSIILAAVNHDDERYKEIPQWQKDLFWIVMTKDHIWRIPKPFELGIIFGTIPERMVDSILNKNPRAFDKLMYTIKNGAMPGTLPTFALPFIESWANKSFFTDRPIVPRSKSELPSQYQYQPYTTEAAKKIGEVLSRIIGDSSASSPAKIENTIKGLTGGLGSHALNLADIALRKSGVLPDKVKPTTTLSDIPFIKAFTVRYPAAGAASIQQFYDDYEPIKQKFAAINEMVKEFEPEKAKELISSGDLVRLDRVDKALAKGHKLIDMVYSIPNMTAEDKRQLIDTTYLSMIDIAKKGNEVLDQVKKKSGR